MIKEIKPFTLSESFQKTFQEKIPCNPKVIMSYLGKVEMSSFGDAIMLFLEGGQDGRRGHDHGTSGGIEAVTRDPEGIGEGCQAGGGSGDSFAQCEANSKDRQADQDGRGEGDHPQIEGEAFEPSDPGEGQGQSDPALSEAVQGFWTDSGHREAFGEKWDRDQ